VLAIGIWLYAAGRLQKEETLLDVPLEVRHAKGLSAHTEVKSLRKVRVHGPRDTLVDMRNRKIFAKITVDQSALKGTAGTKEINYKVIPEYFNLPDGVTLTDVEPPQVSVFVSRIETRMLKVKPVLVRIAPGFEEGHITPIPSEIRVEGPKYIFEKYNLKHLETFPITLNYDQANFIYTARLKNEFEGCKLDVPQTVFVNIELRRVKRTKVFKDVPVHLMFLSLAPAPVKVKLTPAKLAQLEFQGPSEALKELKPEDIRLYVEIDNTVLEAINQGHPRKVEVKCNWPKRIREISVNLENLRISVDRIQEATK